MANVHGNVSDSEFGNPWERMSDVEDSDDAEEVCTCHLSDGKDAQRNQVGQMLLREREEDSIPEAVVQQQPIETVAIEEEAEEQGDNSPPETKTRESTELPPLPLSDVPDTHIALAWLVTLCFNIPLGIVAICMSMKAAKLYIEGKRKRGRRYTKLSLYSSLGGIVVTVVTVMSVILYLAVREAADRRRRQQG